MVASVATAIANVFERINILQDSVATVMTDVFSKKLNYDVNKIAKTVRIFMEIEHIKNRGVTFWLERIGPLFPTLWSGHEFGQNL